MRLLLISLLATASLVGSTPFVAAQPSGPDPDWVVQFGGAGDATALAVDIVDEYGGSRVAVAGHFSGDLTAGSYTATAHPGGTEAFVALLGASGAPLWLRLIGGTGSDDTAEGTAVTSEYDWMTQTTTRTVYVAATFSGTVTVEGGAQPDTIVVSRGLRDGLLVAYSEAGDRLWLRQMGGPGDDVLHGLAQGSQWVPGTGREARVVAVGSFSAAVTWGSMGAVSAGGTDGFVVEYGADGLLRTLYTLGGAGDDDVSDVEYDNSIAVGGTFRDTVRIGPVTLVSRGLSDAFAAVLPAEAHSVLHVGGPGVDIGRGVTGSYFDGVTLLGEFDGGVVVGEDTLASAGASDVFLATKDWRFTGSGVLTHVHAFRFGRVGADRGTDADRMTMWYGDAGGDIPVVAGVLSDGPAGLGGTDGFAFSEYASAVVGGPSDDRIEALGANCRENGSLCDEVATAGSFQQTAHFGTHTLTSAGGDDAFVARYGRNAFSVFETGAAEAAPGAEAWLRVGPNPSRGGAAVRLDLAASGSVTVDVLDALGRTIVRLHDGVLATGEVRWTLPASLPAGVYVVRVYGAVTAHQPVTVVR